MIKLVLKVRVCLTVSNSTASPSRSIFSYSLDSLKNVSDAWEIEKSESLVRPNFGKLKVISEDLTHRMNHSRVMNHPLTKVSIS